MTSMKIHRQAGVSYTNNVPIVFPALPNTIVIAVRHDGFYVDETAHFTHITGIS